VNDLTMIEMGLVIAAGFLASAISTSLGFGFGITVVSALQFFVPPVQIVGLGVMMSFFNYLFRAVESRDVPTNGIAWRVSLAGMLGVPLGVLFLSIADPLFLRRYISVGILAATGLFLVSSAGNPSPPPQARSARTVQLLSGGVGGFMAGSANLGGFTVAFCSVLQDWEKHLAHGVFSRYFLATTSMTVLGMLVFGLYDRVTFLAGLGMAPVVWAGFAVGTPLRDRIPQQHFKYSVLVLLAVLAVLGFLNTFRFV